MAGETRVRAGGHPVNDGAALAGRRVVQPGNATYAASWRVIIIARFRLRFGLEMFSGLFYATEGEGVR